MRATIVHLSGSKRGRAETFDQDRIRIGTHPGNDLIFDLAVDWAVLPFHGEIRFDNGGFLLEDLGGGIFVNDRMVPEVILQDGDFVEVGEGGPKLRFRIQPEDQAASKPLRHIVSDSHAIARHHPRGGLVSATTFVKHLAIAVYREASWRVRTLALLVLLFVVGTFVATLGFTVGGYMAGQQAARAVTTLATEMKAERLSRQDLTQRIEQERRRLEAAEGEVAALLKERERLRGELERTERKIEGLEAHQSAGERIIARYAGGIAFIQGAVAFVDAAGRPLRYVDLDERGEPRRDPSGRPLLSVDGKGPVATTHYSGSGFLVSRDGKILTNRHVAEPWGDDESLLALTGAGFQPKVTMLRAFFPKQKRPFAARLLRTSEAADVVLLKVDTGGTKIPILPLARTGRGAVAGQPVILLGYPTGVEALVAKADPKTLQALMAADLPDVYRLADALAQHGLIRPSTTRGFLGDVQPHQIAYDAQTAVGGSGGPLLNTDGRVIAINYAVLTGFAGSNFGIPIKFGLDLLRQQ